MQFKLVFIDRVSYKQKSFQEEVIFNTAFFAILLWAKFIVNYGRCRWHGLLWFIPLPLSWWFSSSDRALLQKQQGLPLPSPCYPMIIPDNLVSPHLGQTLTLASTSFVQLYYLCLFAPVTSLVTCSCSLLLHTPTWSLPPPPLFDLEWITPSQELNFTQMSIHFNIRTYPDS